jgi:protein-S-isoprenylcysteine O-methyltransferase Ste14
MTGAWVSALIPVIMLAGFVFANIPALDAHLHAKYGTMFDEYAKHTPKLIPLVY